MMFLTTRLTNRVLLFSLLVHFNLVHKSQGLKKREDIMNNLVGKEYKLFDFTQVSSVDDWEEKSDTVRRVGMSMAVLSLQKTQVFQRAVLFTLLNPQPDNAGFAGVQKQDMFDLSSYRGVEIKSRGQGQNNGYKVVLRHKHQNEEPYPTYEQMFTSTNEFSIISLPLSEFKPFYRGRALNETEVGPLDTSLITSYGLQVYGGVYLEKKQHGTSSLEIDWIRAV